MASSASFTTGGCPHHRNSNKKSILVTGCPHQKSSSPFDNGEEDGKKQKRRDSHDSTRTSRSSYAPSSSSSSSSSSSAASNMEQQLKPPEPPGRRPIVGHLPLLAKFMKEHGGCPEMIPAINGAFQMVDSDIVSIDIPGLAAAGLYLTSSPEYAGIVSTDHEHFGKITHLDKRGGYYSSRKVVGNALFVASDTDPDWGKAHRVLMPAFSPAGLKSLADITLRKTDILLDRMKGAKPFEIGNTFTSITFDVIGNYVGGPGLDFKTTEYPERMATEIS